MPSTDATATTDRREFRMWFPWGLPLVWWPVAAAGLWFWTMNLAVLLASFGDWENPSPICCWVPWPSPVAAVGFSLSGASLLVLLVARLYVLDARRALIVLTPGGIAITDRRRRTRDIPWREIHELRLRRWDGPTFGPTLRLSTSAGIVRLPELIVEQEALAKEIITNAGLPELQKGWFRLTYRRARSSS